MTNITTQAVHTIHNSVFATIARLGVCTPKQALATAVVFADNAQRLVDSGINWEDKMEMGYEETLIDGEHVEAYDMFTALLDTGFVLDGALVGPSLQRILDEDKTSYAPALASVGVERRRGYAPIKTSKLFKEAIHVLEGTEFMKSDVMTDIASQVYALQPEHTKLKAQQYVLNGTSDMESGVHYVSEFFGDKRGRIYQAACYGPNGQSSDMARALMDLAGVSMDYDTKATIKLLVDEMKDMGQWSGKAEFMADLKEAATNSANFILNHIGKDYHVSKPWNFTKFAMLVVELQRGNKPYVGIAVGLDAKCSGPQLGALMVADEKMLKATGFTEEMVADAYEHALQECIAVGIIGLDRALVKKPFMAVFYGAGRDSLMDERTITQPTWDALYNNVMPEDRATVAEKFHKAIVKSFGTKLNNVRSSIKSGGFNYETKEVLFDKPVRHYMPDGLEVAMDYMEKVNINGELIGGRGDDKVSAVYRTVVNSGLEDKHFKKLSFSLDTYNLNEYGRTGFVNMIQATDALLARLIIVHANRLGAQHIIAIHDCFRVNIHDMAILEDAIKLAYLDMFGSTSEVATADMPMGQDILGLYFQGALEATKEEHKATAPYKSQFFVRTSTGDTTKVRRLDYVGQYSVPQLINDLGTTCYFSK